MRPGIDDRYSETMLKLIIAFVLLSGGFAGGFYAGIQHRNQQLVDNPQLFLEEYGKDLKTKASAGLKKLIDAIGTE